jgi:predicted amidophosphoribosyltransferase
MVARLKASQMSPRFVYKINTTYDNFTPSEIESRLRRGRVLKLGWTRYLDEVYEGNVVWVYFRGPRIEPGIYARGKVKKINYSQRCVWLEIKPNEFAAESPLGGARTTNAVHELVSAPYLQVFPWPQSRNRERRSDSHGAPHLAATVGKPRPPAQAAVECGPKSCEKRLCENCRTWKSLKLIQGRDVDRPARFCETDTRVIPAYWIVPNRCQFKRSRLRPEVHEATDMFMAFKTGQKEYAFPLAFGIYKALRAQRQGEFDAIVPIPLSPDKIKTGELHRTRALAKELSALVGTPVKELLTLSKSISKRRFLKQKPGHTGEFEDRYYKDLRVNRNISKFQRVLLVDDVMTHGSTASRAIQRLSESAPDTKFVVAVAGQMIVKSAVRRQSGFLKR